MQRSPNSVRLIPYCEINGARTLPDTFLEDVFDEMVVQGLLSTVFVGTIVRNAEEFIALMRSPTNVPVFIVSGNQCLGFAWLNGVGVTYAYGHFCTFENDVMSPTEMGEMVLGYWWSLRDSNDEPVLRVILGTIPAFNAKAIGFAQKLGMVKVGEVPDLFFNPQTKERWPAVILYCKRP